MTPPPKGTSRLDRPLRPALIVVLGASIVAAPAWLFADSLGYFYPADPFGNFTLIQDDFPYLAQSRTRSALLAHLGRPHNAHVVPLFRLWTHAVCTLAGSLANLPTVVGTASYGVLVLVMLAGGHFVAREARSKAVGLAAMVGLGLTTVMEPATTWYAAGQALWAGLGILAMLLALQSWRESGGAWRLGLAALAAIAAPGFWSGGYVAGPVGAAYLWADGRPRCRKAAALPLVAALAVGLVFLAIAGRQVLASVAAPQGRRGGSAIEAIRGVSHTFQAIPEVLILNNLGLDGATSAHQGGALCLGLVALWAWSRRRDFRLSPLEAAGAALVVTSFVLVFTFRRDYPYESLRDLGWYHAIPQIGAVLFAAGWWSALATPPVKGPRAVTARGALVIVGLMTALLLLHLPRAQRLFLVRIPPLTASERHRYPIPELQRLRGIYLAAERAERQRRALARLDRAGVVARRLGLSKGAIRRVFGPVTVPGWPETVRTPDALDLLDLPATGPADDPARIQAALRELLLPEPETRPPWLPPGESWPPR